MKLYYFDSSEINTFTLPDKVIGDFWMTDSKGKNIINISADNNNWVISSGSNIKIIFHNSVVDNILLKSKTYYIIEQDGISKVLFVDDIVDRTFNCFRVETGNSIILSNFEESDIVFNNNFLNDFKVTFSYENSLKISQDSIGYLYVNNYLLKENEYFIKNGDVINILGNKFIFVFNLIFMNNPLSNIRLNSTKLSNISLNVNDSVTEEEIIDKDMYEESDYYLISPRLRRSIKTFELKIDSPPAKENQQEMPLILTLGPMLTMGASSMVSISTVLSKIADGETTVEKNIPTLVISGAMLVSMLVWPFLTKLYNKKTKFTKERKRQRRYSAYIDMKKTELVNEYNSQLQILEENLLTTNECYDIILNKKRILWGRKLDQDDFLTVRVGKGQVPFDANISYQSEDFTMEDDKLRKKLDDLILEYKVINNAPVSYSFVNNKITAINGIFPKYLYFMNNCLLQMMAFHSYSNLKIIIFTNKNNSSRWEYLKSSSYCFSNDKNIRFFATNTEEMQDISLYLEQIFNGRKLLSENNQANYSDFNCYYLVLIDDIDMARKIKIIENILEEKKNLGFSLVILEEKLAKLPSQCNNFININDKTSGILNNDFSSNSQTYFIDEVSNQYDMINCSYVLSNLPIFIDSVENKLPNSVTFLEMFGVGKVEQLNSLNRWKDNDPTKSLKTEIGINENGDSFILDIHEKQHGPHGLIAGMTGSGKSESIITYVLSMAINYSPEEVAFVLIDYKGGGLAGAFENKELGIRLPHVVGTITNLDKAEINRSLASIDSELRRRQAKFNEVRDMTGESTIDIYKYQRMYRDHLIDEPIPHLIIVCDEFAELKAQQPDFMDDLVSTARIGRSLGVHLILATQKPSGVVDAQIWSNSKFKICLKVQDKSDSIEMIKCADAAELKNVGRFYLQVGYNEYFALGQSAWAGAPYYPSDEFKKNIDKNIYFINNIGNINKMIDNTIAKKVVKSDGEELSNVLKYIIDISNTMDFKIKQLWLERIPNQIFINNLIRKYNYQKIKFDINPVIGEYDDPSNQKQGLLTLPLTREGNALIYGMSDSGRDEFLQGLIYSLLTTYSSEEINLYLLDYGAETLINFSDAPQIGDVLINGDDEKLSNLVKMLNSEVDKRKKLFMAYNGNYRDYIKAGKIISNIVVVINVVEVMTETYQDISEKLFVTIREGYKYGINFVLTTTNQTTIRFKMAQSCKQILCLQLNNETDYRDILGRTNGLVPFKCLGRGLVKLESICEFQTGFIDSDENKNVTIKKTIDKLNTLGYKKAKAIPIMPEVLKLSKFISKFEDLRSFPIGVTKESLSTCLYDYTKNVINIISSTEINNARKFMLNYLKLAEANVKFNKIIVDAVNYFDKFNYQNMSYINNDFNKLIDNIYEYDKKVQDILVGNNMNIKSLSSISNSLIILFGIDKFLSKLDEEHRKIFKDIIINNKETLKIIFVVIDIPSNFKKYEYDDWYKNSVDNNNGLWIGTGITQQYVIKTIVQPAVISNIDNDYGVVVKNGIPTLIKLINEINN